MPLIIKDKFIILPIGLVVKVGLSEEPPQGFRKMLLSEGYKFKEQLKKLLDCWSIVAFETGKIDGEGYGYKLHESFGS
jgi:hypothetical protein